MIIFLVNQDPLFAEYASYLTKMTSDAHPVILFHMYVFMSVCMCVCMYVCMYVCMNESR